MHNGPANSSTDTAPADADLVLLKRVAHLLEMLQSRVLAASVDDEVLRDRVVALQRCESMLYAEKLRSIAEVEERKAFRGAAHQSTPDWLADATGLSLNEARAHAHVAAALTRLPGTAQQLADGAIGAGQADAAAAGLRDLDAKAKQRREDCGGDVDAWLVEDQRAAAIVAAFDAMLAETAPAVDRAELGRRIDAWTITHDPDTVEDRDAGPCGGAGRRSWDGGIATGCGPRSTN